MEWLATIMAAYMVFKLYSSSPLHFTVTFSLGLIGSLILWNKIEYAPIFVALLLPFREVHVVSIFHVKRLAIWGLLLYVMLRGGHFLRPKRDHAFQRFQFSTFFMLVAVMLSLLVSAKAVGTMADITPEMFRRGAIPYAFVFLDLFAMTYLAYYSLQTPSNIRRLLDTSLIVAAFVGGLGIAQYYAGGEPRYVRAFFNHELVFFGRATSVFDNPNEFGAYLGAMVLVAIFSFLVETHSRAKRFGFYLPIIGLTLAAQFLSFSRGSLIQTLLGGLIGLWVYYFKFMQKKISWKLVAFIGTVVIVVIFSPQIYDMFMRFRIGIERETEYQKALYWTRTASDSLRKYTIIQSLKSFREHPFFGVGFHLFGAKRVASGLSAHNQFLSILVEMGLFGFLSFLFMVGSIMTKAWGCLNIASAKENQRLALLVFIGMSSIIFGFFFTDTLLMTSVTGNWWLLAGAVFVLMREQASGCTEQVQAEMEHA